jgi:hypothetical protein
MGVLVLLAVVIRHPATLLTSSFWLDEAWVVDSVRAPFGQLHLMTSSTPVGWTLLLRLVPPVGGPERYRLLPLAFAAAAVVPAYLLGHWLGRLHATLAGLAVALLPAALSRTWLKQYPAEVLVALTLALLLARVEAAWSRRRLAVFGAVAAGSMLLSNTAPFVTAAAFTAMAAAAVLARRPRRLLDLVLVAVPVAAVQLSCYMLFTGDGDNTVMRRYWAAFMLPPGDGPGAAVELVAGRLRTVIGQVGFGPAPVALALAVIGGLVFWRSGLRAVALLPALVGGVLLAAGVAGRYPFLDQRTSLFALALLAVHAAAGLGALAAAALRRRSTAPAGVALLAIAAVLAVPAADRATHNPIPGLSVARQVAEIQSGRRPGDAIAVSFGASFAFAYYWPGQPTFSPASASTAVRFEVDYPDRPSISIAHTRDAKAISAALARVARPNRRVWIVVGDQTTELPAWRAAAARLGPVTSPGAGPGPLLLVQRPSGHTPVI